MQEVNLNKIINFNLFYLYFCFGPQVFIGNSSFRICGFVLWSGGVTYIILLHTHIKLSQQFTKNKELYVSSLHSLGKAGLISRFENLSALTEGHHHHHHHHQ